MNIFDIYKISQCLTNYEETLGVIKVDPIWGDSLTPFEFYEYMVPRVAAARRLLLPGELGCALAHLGIYNRISKVRRSALILEADIELQSSNIQQVKKVLEQIREPDFLHLARYSTEFEKFELNSNLYVVYTASGFWGTAAYYISPNVADALILHHSRFIDLADNWQEFFVKSSFTPFYAPIFDHTGDESSIAGNRILAQNPSLKDAIRLRFLRKRMTMLARLRFQKQISFAKRIVDIPK